MTSAALPAAAASVPRYRIGLTITAMDQLQLRPMTVAEFETYQARLVPGYAAEHVRAGDWTADAAEALPAGQVNDLLPAGPDSPGMLLLMASTSGGEPVGLVWVALDRPCPGEAWIYDIEVNPEHPGERLRSCSPLRCRAAGCPARQQGNRPERLRYEYRRAAVVRVIGGTDPLDEHAQG